MQVELLTKQLEPAYTAFLLKRAITMASMSIAYRDLLIELLDAGNQYLIAIDQGNVVGALPLLAKDNPKYGRVYNSLPFYGSNGAIIGDGHKIRLTLLERYLELLQEDGSAAGTIITTPFQDDSEFYLNKIHGVLVDFRIGQFTVLPENKAELMPLFHHKTRNAVRKGERSGLEINWENGERYLDFLIETHETNSESIGIPSKPPRFFSLLPKYFEYGTGYRIYTALKDGAPVAALLTLYFNKTADYFVPATISEFREIQPMSFIVYRAMCDAIDNDFKVWNWGGTAEGAKGVYDFKKRWGTTDRNYHYFTAVSNPAVKTATSAELLAKYPNFYVLPFSELGN